MAITPYTGQPLTPGMLVCRRSILISGFAARPVTIVKVAGSRAIVRDRDGDEARIGLTTIAFLVDTEEEGLALHEASISFVESEREHERLFQQARSERKRAAIQAVIDRTGA